MKKNPFSFPQQMSLILIRVKKSISTETVTLNECFDDFQHTFFVVALKSKRKLFHSIL